MNALDLTRRMDQHRTWVNRQLLAAAAALSAEQLHQTFPIGQGSIWKSLVHMWAAEHVWLEALHGHEQALAPGDVAGKLPGNQEGPGGVHSIAELERAWTALAVRWQEYLQSLSNEQLDDLVYKVRSLGGRFAFRRSDVLLHVHMHAHYTAAQVMNMLRHAGATSLPDPMVISLVRSEPPLG
ncbi:MAG: DinB family protein [Pirellulales bacterium]